MKHNGGEQHTSSRSPDAILAEIERTRGEMDTTLSAIEQRLTPGQLVDQGLDYLRSSGANEFVHNLGGQVKNNPMPIALMGIGIAWLMASGRQSQPGYSSSYSQSTAVTTGTGYMDAGSARAKLGERAGELRDQASGVAQSAKDKMSQGSQAVKDRLSAAGSSLSSAGQSARQGVSNLTDSARYQVERARDGVDYMLREQPLALGAIGVAIGALLAAVTPRTRKEDELMGETRDRLMDQAKEVGKEKLEQAKEVANAAVGTATKEAEKRGLTPQPASSSSSAAPAGFGGSQPPAPASGPKPPMSGSSSSASNSSSGSTSSKPTVGVHHSFDDSPAQTVPPTPQPASKPSITPTPGNTGGSRNPR
jgi:hypothetical protein